MKKRKRKRPTWGCTKAELAALDYIGNHRKTPVIPRRKSCPVSVRMANRLVRMKWAMYWGGGEQIMLTWEGERRWSLRHPYSKYSVVKARRK